MTYYYHGTSSIVPITHLLLPPSATTVLAERGRKKNLDRVFFTRDPKLAHIYAGRTTRVLGGSPVIYRVIPMTPVTTLRDSPGATVLHCEWAFVEPLIGTPRVQQGAGR